MRKCINCKTCNKQFTVKSDYQSFCSEKCSRKHNGLLSKIRQHVDMYHKSKCFDPSTVTLDSEYQKNWKARKIKIENQSILDIWNKIKEDEKCQ